ncbi:MAG: ABC transporter permease [Planctomycetota bacterium]|jgi:ABC-type dipeptide/oligopeptide/nickel transport system permease component|nr:ABC transporter permease [Planctomycetota bacterium]
MIRQLLKRVSAAVAVIIGVELILFFALQSSVFGDPIKRETNASNDPQELIAAAHRLGMITTATTGVISLDNFTPAARVIISYDKELIFSDINGKQLAAIYAETLSDLIHKINSSGVCTAELHNPKLANATVDSLDIAYFNYRAESSNLSAINFATIEVVPQYQQAINKLVALSSFDFGLNHQGRPVTTTLIERGLRSLAIAAPAFSIIFFAAFWLAVLVQNRPRLKKCINLIAALFMALPALFVIFIIRQALVIEWQLAPLRPYGEPIAPLFILPILIAIVIGIWPEYLLMRSFVSNRLQQPFILAARAQGISESRIWWRHLLPNLAGPLSQHVALNLPFLILGSLLLETIFNIPGLGTSIVDAVQNHDSNTLHAITFIIAICFIACQQCAIIVARIFDPRQRSEVSA